MVLIPLALVVVVLGVLFVVQRSLIYFPERMSRAAFEAAVSGSLEGRTSVLAPFDAIVFEPSPDTPVVGTAILFHGNAGSALDRAYLAPTFTARGLRLVLAEYPGYGARAGSPSETSITSDAIALYGRVAGTFPATAIVVVGESLGTGVAVQVAASGTIPAPARVVLLTPFLSLAETAARAYPFLPARYLVRDRFDSATALPRYQGPVAVLVAGRDEVVGADQGRSLAAVARQRGETVLVELPDAGHNSWSALITGAQWTQLLGAR